MAIAHGLMQDKNIFVVNANYLLNYLSSFLSTTMT